MFVPCSAYQILRGFGPEEYGGFGDLEAKTIAEMQSSGKNILDASNKVSRDLMLFEIYFTKLVSDRSVIF